MDRRRFLVAVGPAALAAGVGLTSRAGCCSAGSPVDASTDLPPGSPTDPATGPMTDPRTIGPRATFGPAPASVRRTGLQLYTVRGEMDRDFEGTLARVAEIGYEEVEFAGYFGRSPAQVRAALAAAGLDAPASHVDFAALPGEDAAGRPPAAGADDDAWFRTLDAAAEVGHRWVVVPWIPASARADLDGYRRVAARFERAGERAHRAGLRFAYHNHDFEFEGAGGEPLPFDLLLAGTDPDLVDFELDVYWTVRGGGDPLAYFRRFPGRFPLAHFKDMDADGNMADLGAGRIDFAAILAERERAGMRHAFVEHDEPADPMATARAGARHLRELLR